MLDFISNLTWTQVSLAIGALYFMLPYAKDILSKFHLLSSKISVPVVPVVPKVVPTVELDNANVQLAAFQAWQNWRNFQEQYGTPESIQRTNSMLSDLTCIDLKKIEK